MNLYRAFIFIVFCIISISAFGQENAPLQIKQMKWGVDYQIYLKLNNDTAYSIPIEDLFHAQVLNNPSGNPEFTYFPVNFDSSFINDLRDKYSGSDFTYETTTSIKEDAPQTLWGVLNTSLGGGWVHFVNCMLYSIETRQIDIKSPLMKRPLSSWKPKPMTETYKRTSSWEYYIPVKQREAHKEYKARKKENKLGDLASIPQSFITLFLKTNECEYNRLIKKKQFHLVAKIDLVKLMMGSNYLSLPQISYVKSSVLKAATKYSYRQMPSVLIFDQYNAAVALTMDESGYKIENIVFKAEEEFSAEDLMQKEAFINSIIKKINDENKAAFQKRLKEYYIKPAALN